MPSRPPRQIPLQFQHAPATTRDDLIVSDPISAAVAIVDRWPDWPSPVVVLAGPAGAGKTHLAGIWRETAYAQEITATAFDSEAAIAAAAAGPILIEDAERAGFGDQTLFHIINAVRQHETSLLMTTRMWPSAWSVELPDLKSRLKAATVVEIGEPDDAMLAQVIVKLFADRQVGIDDRVVGYLVARMERSLEAAQTIVANLDALALATGRRITRPLAAEALAALGQDDDRGEAS